MFLLTGSWAEKNNYSPPILDSRMGGFHSTSFIISLFFSKIHTNGVFPSRLVGVCAISDNLYYWYGHMTDRGGSMELSTIGKNIRNVRKAKKMRQEDLAEKTGLSVNYIGNVERGEKIPSLETFLKIVNALGVTSDVVLADVLDAGYVIRSSMLSEKMEKLPQEERQRIFDVIETLMRHNIT